MMLAGDFKPLGAYEKLGAAAMLSLPTPDHYLPLLSVIATRRHGENITYSLPRNDAQNGHVRDLVELTLLLRTVILAGSRVAAALRMLLYRRGRVW
jgi:hypothetical protein